MATQTLESSYVPGLASRLTSKLFAIGNDTIVATASSVTEATNRGGRYKSVYTDVPANDYLQVQYLDGVAGSSEIYTLTLTTATFQPWSETGYTSLPVTLADGAITNAVIANNAITAAGIAAAALNGKGDWNTVTPDNTSIGAIKSKTDNLPSDPADASDIATAFGSIAATLAAIVGYIDTEVAAIKAKTDNLPSDPADASDIAASFSSIASTLSTIAGYVDTEVSAIKAKTDQLVFTVANQVDSNSMSGSISASDIRSAIGLATANLDAQLDAIPTNAELSNALAGADDALLAAVGSPMQAGSTVVLTDASLTTAKLGTFSLAKGTNLTGLNDLNAGQVTTAATAATPIAASVTGNVGGNVVGTVSSVADKTGYELTSNERNLIAAVVDATLLNAGDATDLIASIVTRIGNTNVDQAAFVAAVKAALFDTASAASKLNVDGSGRVLLQPTQLGVTIPAVTTLTTLPSAPTDWLTAAGVKADAVSKIQAGLAAVDGNGDVPVNLVRIAGTPVAVDTGTAGVISFLSGEYVAVTGATVQANIVQVDGENVRSDNDGRLTVDIDYAGMRGELGLAAANLDEQFAELSTAIADLPTNSELSTALAESDDDTLAAITAEAIKTLAIKLKTDQLTFTVTNQVDANALTVGSGSGDIAITFTVTRDTDAAAVAGVRISLVGTLSKDTTGTLGTAQLNVDGDTDYTLRFVVPSGYEALADLEITVADEDQEIPIELVATVPTAPSAPSLCLTVISIITQHGRPAADCVVIAKLINRKSIVNGSLVGNFDLEATTDEKGRTSLEFIRPDQFTVGNGQYRVVCQLETGEVVGTYIAPNTSNDTLELT